MTYVIHGATGAQGAPIVSALVAAGKPVAAVSRGGGAVSGAHAVAADLSSVDALTAAYSGADGVFVHLPLVSEEHRLVHARAVVAAVRSARPGRVVVSTSGSGGGAPRDPSAGAVALLVNGLEDSGVSCAVLTPRLFLENLLLPPVVGGTREEGVLRYPLRAGFPVAWSSHLDVADAAVALLARPDVTGDVAVGQDPAVTGDDLAAAFSERFGRKVIYEAQAPAAFGESVAPLIGAGPATGVAALYEMLGQLPGLPVETDRSAQTRLGVTPRSIGQWLADLGF